VRHQDFGLLSCNEIITDTVSYNLKKTFAIILIFILFSCKEKDNCYPEFKESLSYLKESIDPNDNQSRLVVEIHRNIKVLESISGILNKDRGMHTINVMFVTQDDIANWETWVSKKCDSINQKPLN
jgi:hypothetical protein